ncbi:putative quinol monooxygenase [Micromonospora sp. IBHARD004]|uniref:putative quinol monooxygenase n=1 Tax=Micromonospora sp. IBHARD004 TaxID=3457764 RepID=UPI004059CCFB
MGAEVSAQPGRSTVLIVAGSLYVDPDGRDAYLASCAETVRQARSAPGCIDFAVSADLVEPGRINVYERWETDEQLLDFRGSGPSEEQTVAILGAEVHRYRISGVEAP